MKASSVIQPLVQWQDQAYLAVQQVSGPHLIQTRVVDMIAFTYSQQQYLTCSVYSTLQVKLKAVATFSVVFGRFILCITQICAMVHLAPHSVRRVLMMRTVMVSVQACLLMQSAFMEVSKVPGMHGAAIKIRSVTMRYAQVEMADVLMRGPSALLAQDSLIPNYPQCHQNLGRV